MPCTLPRSNSSRAPVAQLSRRVEASSHPAAPARIARRSRARPRPARPRARTRSARGARAGECIAAHHRDRRAQPLDQATADEAETTGDECAGHAEGASPAVTGASLGKSPKKAIDPGLAPYPDVRMSIGQGSIGGSLRWRAAHHTSEATRTLGRRGEHDHEAFRITAAERSDDVTIRTKGRRLHDHLGRSCASGSRRVGRGSGEARPQAGRDGLLDALQLPGVFTSATSRLCYSARRPSRSHSTYSPEQISYLLSDAEAKLLICEQQYLRRLLEERVKACPEARARDSWTREAPQGATSRCRWRARTPASMSRPSVALAAADRCTDSDLHLGHDRAAKGVQLIHRNLLAAVRDSRSS